MSDTLIAGLRTQLGLAEDADVATVLAANAEALAERADPPAANSTAVLAAAATAEAPEGMTLVSTTLLATLQEGAQAGIAARAAQQTEARDRAIAAAFSAGKISADSRADWATAWDLRPEQTQQELDSLGVRFPVAKTAAGYPSADTGVETAPFSDDEADALAQLAGVSKEGLLR